MNRPDTPQSSVQTPVVAALPLVTYALIALNVGVFIVLMLTVQFGIGPAELDYRLALWSPAIAEGEYFRLLTSAFMHYTVVHLLLNMWALYLMGPELERMLGWVRFSSLYLLSALGGSVTVYLVAPLDTTTAGASGAVFGLFGATLVMARRLHLDTGWITVIILINLAFTFSIPNISWEGHVGGLVIGTLLALVYFRKPRKSGRKFQVTVTLELLLMLIALIWWRTSELSTNPAAFAGLS